MSRKGKSIEKIDELLLRVGKGDGDGGDQQVVAERYGVLFEVMKTF